MTNNISFNRWDVLVINQKESRETTDPNQPLDESKDTRRFIVVSKKDPRPMFNCIEVVSLKGSVFYPDVEINEQKPVFTVKSVARVGMIYTLSKKLNGLKKLGSITDINIKRKIIVGIKFYLPTDDQNP